MEGSERRKSPKSGSCDDRAYQIALIPRRIKKDLRDATGVLVLAEKRKKPVVVAWEQTRFKPARVPVGDYKKTGSCTETQKNRPFKDVA